MLDNEKVDMDCSVRLNSTVSVKFSNGVVRVFNIVSDSNTAAPESGIISIHSPLGMALLGKQEGSKVAYSINQNRVSVKILNVQ